MMTVPQPRDGDGAQTKDLLLSIPIEPRHNPCLKRVAAADGRSVSGYVRWLILKDLQAQGVIDETFTPIDPATMTGPLPAVTQKPA